MVAKGGSEFEAYSAFIGLADQGGNYWRGERNDES
jgi:hypothetical protein